MPLLWPGEQVLRQETVEYEDRYGRLFLTTHRLLIEGTLPSGLIGRALHGERFTTLLDTQLQQLSGVHVDRRLLGRSRLRIEFNGTSHELKVDDATSWQAAIMATLQRPPPTHGGHTPVVVNVHQAAAPPPPPPPPPAVFLHCRHCGSLSPAGVTRCASCGASL